MTTSPANSSATTVWRNPAADPEVRLAALIAEMTLAEKVAQLGSVWLGFDGRDRRRGTHAERLQP